ncbi:hypothetical protein [Clostridium tagluense]|uniref:Uncharacterized protein n=1 Tax=Clostridium tagluense TaxID=360422 RepID=A0A401UI78_9CLOT|nr:hypothetical protein [Clostridium tagluense]GCD09182.1 hypothetical protein Ctaglu_08050 [Clostridium tagluense]
MEYNKKLQNRVEDYVAKMKLYQQQMLEKYPPNPPNDVCYHALLAGIMIENSFGPKVHDYTNLFRTEYEKIFIWTHSKDSNSALISEVNTKIKSLPFWKTIGHVLHLAQYYYNAFEIINDFDIKYNWTYYFDKNKMFEELELMDSSYIVKMDLRSGVIIKATEIEAMAPLIELILRDDVCYTSLSQMLSSFELHYCCLTCELGLSPVIMHESHEPELWEHPYYIAKMEAAIIQACRCVESILGEPPSRTNKNGLMRHKGRWTECLQINADDIFEKVGITYLEFYYKLFFDLRNPSAHSYGNIHFDLERKKVIEAQCFAALILRAYITSNIKSHEESLRILCFNQDLLTRVLEDISTKITK